MAVNRAQGELHPSKPYYWETSANNGKGDWRNLPKSGNIPGTNTPVSAASASRPAASASGTKMTPAQAAVWSKTAKEESLLKIVNNKNGNLSMRKIAYDALEERGYDMSTVDTSGNLATLFKMTSGNKNVAASQASSGDEEDYDLGINIPAGAQVNINGNNVDGTKITERWYLNKNDDRVKKLFNLKTKDGRVKYDKFVYDHKIKEKDYKNPVEVVQNLNEQYLEFLDNEEQRFMISAGGAGIGKSYGFNKMAELLNKRPFEEGDAPGEDDYDIFEAPDVNSGKQLLNILKAHNGKIIVFDDNDKVLTRADCASVMKKATATTGKRIVGDPDDIKQNFEFTGRIIIMTNKDLATLSESEDTKAIVSRAMMSSEIYMTVPETIEVMQSRYQDYEFPAAPRLDDETADKNERNEIMNLIESNKGNIDPAQFTTRTFQEILTNKRKVDNANEKRSNPAFAALIGTKQKDWKSVALDVLTKAVEVTEDTIEKAVEEKEIVVLGIEKADDLIDEEISIEKAELLLFGKE